MDLDYEKLGFKCGIEIHQQLDTHKLFCSCPSVIREDVPDLRVERKMRAVAGELGEVDPAALHEFLKNRSLIYEAYSDTTCLVELDEEPPHPLNEEALEVALEVAFLLNSRPVDELHVMRKTVIDGSNTTGFQRTLLVAMDGELDTSKGKVGILSICLEEDAARKIEEKEGVITYRLDRLGIPLVEIATAPNIQDPVHAREVAEKLGSMLRATGKVKRGLGTIRQDLNVSIKGGARIEVKGVQALNDVSKIIENEVLRQKHLVELKNELNSRKVKAKDLDSDFIDVTSVFSQQGKDWIKKKISEGEKVSAVKLKGFHGLLGLELMPDYRYGTELAKIAKSTTGLGGIIHSDEKLDDELRSKLNSKLNVSTGDGFICVVAGEALGNKTLSILVDRCKVAIDGVPEETRSANGVYSEYMRPLPGSHRMYPETDEPLVNVDSSILKKIKSNLPELIEDKAKRYEKTGLSGELASQLSKSNLTVKFEEYARKYSKLKPTAIAAVLLMAPKEAKKRFNADTSKLEDRHFDEILGLLVKGQISKDSVIELLTEASKSPGRKLSEVATEKNLTVIGGEDLEKIIDGVVKKATKDVNQNALLGMVMGACKGRANPMEVKALLGRKLG